MHTPLEIIELSKVYNKKEAVKNISFKINKNEIIGNSWVQMVVEKLQLLE